MWKEASAAIIQHGGGVQVSVLLRFSEALLGISILPLGNAQSFG